MRRFTLWIGTLLCHVGLYLMGVPRTPEERRANLELIRDWNIFQLEKLKESNK